MRQLSVEASARVVELRCVAPHSVLEARVARRAEGPSVSDADPQVVRALAAQFAPWPEATELFTTRPVDSSIARAVDIIDRAPLVR